MTVWERKLWYDFLRDYPVRFHRQHVLGNYIVDFYCPRAKLVIELDGSGHYYIKQQQYDQDRDSYLKSLDLNVIRIDNQDIDRYFQLICESINEKVQESVPLDR